MRSAVDGLCSFTGRGACTDAERRAAVWLHDELRSRGHEAFVETRWVRPQRAFTLALGALLAVIGSLVSTASPVAGLAVAGAGALVLALHWAAVPLPFLPRRATQDVLSGDAPLVVAAAYDAPRRGLVLNDRWRRFLRPRSGAVLCGLAVTAAAGARVAELDAGWLGAAQLVPTVVLLVAVAAAADIMLSGWSPGANDNASGVAVALALHDELAPDVALLLVGAGHAVRRGGIALEIGPCGAGRPVLRGRRIVCLDERGLTPRAHQADDTTVDPASMEAALALAREAVSADARGAAARAMN
jgi:hypothetical protein